MNRKNHVHISRELTLILVKRVTEIMNNKNEAIVEDERELKRLMRDGHSYSCACNILWGNGQCQCEQIKKDKTHWR